MGTLSSCLKKIGLSKHEAAILRGSADDNIKDGDEAHVAAVRAVSDFIEQLEKERASVVGQVIKAGGKPTAAPFALADLAGLTRILRKPATTEPVAYNQEKQPEKENVTDQRSGADLERNREDATTQDGVGAQGVRDGRAGNVRPGEPGVSAGQEGGRAVGGGELLRPEAAATGEHGNLEIYTGAAAVSPGSAGSRVDSGSGDFGLEGSPIEPDAAEAIERASTGRTELVDKTAAQAAANKNPDTGRGLDSVVAALPMLHAGQQEDVVKAEARFDSDAGYGMLFTNGTGTGKTFTGLGIMRRFANEGKRNIIAIAPNDKIIEDWQNSGKMLGLDINRLENTKDSGRGMVITTYANFGANETLADREWDLVVADETHYMLQSKDANETNALATLRAITLHPDGLYARTNMLHRDLVAKLAEADQAAKMARTSDDERDWHKAEELESKANALRRELEQKRDEVKADIAARQGKARPRALFLSATPFAYEKTIDWANGYLFDYNEGQASEEGSFRGYNEGSNRDRFFMRNFGYRMRYNKLTEPDAKVDRGLMQRQFNSWLKKTGSLSGRILDVDADYDRRFVLTESAVGQRIDEALDWFDARQKAYNAGKNSEGGIGSYHSDPYSMALSTLRKHIADKFDYLSRRYLLEAIKAKEVIPHINEHLALGRKVVVFHDYKKGGGFNPFNIHEQEIAADANDEQKQNAEALNRVISEFRHEFADLMEHEVFHSSSPIMAFQEAFPNVLLFNGDVSKKQRRANVARFNDDASGPQVILVQSASGKEGISLHDTSGIHQRVLFNLGQPTQPTTAIQQEGRIYRTGQATDAMFRYLTTGTNWEKWAFATTIAQRASAAENLGMGELARMLKDAFIEAYEEADDYRAGMDGEGKGGKERDRAANEALTDYDRAKSFYFGTQKKTSKNKAAEGADYFATPEPVAYKMVEFAGIRGGNRVLEPSGGHGAIARWFPENAERTAIEPSGQLRPRLAMVFDGKIIDSDFESHNVVNKYDAIVMNPPFGTGGKLAVEHLAKAATHLNDGGRIVALLPAGPMADKRLEKWLYEEAERDIKPLLDHPTLGPVYRGDTITTKAGWAPEGKLVRRDAMGYLWIKPDGQAETYVAPENWTAVKATGPRKESYKPAEHIYPVADIKLPSVTFERAGTRVMTHIVVLEKQADAKKAPAQSVERDYSRIEDIGELFDAMENMTVRERPMTESEQSAAKAEAEADAPAKVERPSQKAEKPAVDMSAASEQAKAEGLEIIEYTTKKGKKLKGVIRTDLTKAQAEAIDPYTWKKDGGYFIRVEHLNSQAYKDSLGKGGPSVLSRSAVNPGGVSGVVDRQGAESLLGRILSTLKLKPQTFVASTFSDLPAEVQQDASDQDSGEYETKGLFHNGTLYLVAGNHSTLADIQETIFHELIGHYGMRQLLGKDVTQQMNRFFVSLGGINGLDRIAKKHGFSKEFDEYINGLAKAHKKDPAKYSQEIVQHILTEEVFAHMAQKEPRLRTGIKKIIDAIRSWLLEHGFDKLLDMNDNDIAYLLAKAKRNLEGGGGPNGGVEAPAVMRRSAAEFVASKFQQASPHLANTIRDTFASNEKFSWWDKTFGTQGNKAHKDAQFAKVYETAQSFERDISRMASEAADLAPDLLPKMDTIGDTLNTAKNVKRDAQDSAAISPWIYFGTLAETTFSDADLQNPDAVIAKYGQLLPADKPLTALTERQRKLYRQYHAAINKSLDDLAIAEMARLARTAKLEAADPSMTLADTARFYFEQVAGEIQRLEAALDELKQEQKAEADLLEDAANDEATGADQRKRYAKLLMDMKAKHKAQREAITNELADRLTLKDGFIGRAQKIKEMQDKGYAPLMRFGKYTVDVTLQDENGKVLTDADGNELRPFFGMFESEAEANAVARELREEYPDHVVTQGILSEHQHKLFAGVTPENVELYAKVVGMDNDEAFQRYLKLATANRSAMKRLIHRKGTAGFSFDATRSLASFITSNSRAAASNLHIGPMLEAVAAIDKAKGDVKDEAIKLMEYVRTPQEGGVAIRSMLFFQYLGGSVAAALTNMTQTFTTTLPYLSQPQFGGFAAAQEEIRKAMALSGRLMRNGASTGDAELDAMLKRATEDGVVAPHEIHMLQGEASRGSGMFANSPVWRSLENKYPALRYTTRFMDAGKSLWGKFFSMAEQYNRQVAFIAAYQLAKQQGKTKEQAYAIAEKAVTATQFSYQKSDRSNLARSAVGATLLTFKTFLINYLEFLKRLPARERAIALGVLVLLSGTQGAPGADDADDIIDTIGQAAGYSTNAKRWKREALGELFGDDEFGKLAADFILHGVSAMPFMPLDVQGRLSVGNIIPATSLFKRDNTSAIDEVAELIGPAGGFAKKVYEGSKAVIDGDSAGHAIGFVMAPKAISDAYQAVDMLQTGVYRDYRGRKVVDVDGVDALVKAIGFQPTAVSSVKRAERMVQQDIALFRNVKQDIAERWARGMFEGDKEKITKAREQLDDWNEKNPNLPMQVKRSQILRRVTEMKKTSGERLVSAAPKEVRGNVEATIRNGESQ